MTNKDENTVRLMVKHLTAVKGLYILSAGVIKSSYGTAVIYKDIEQITGIESGGNVTTQTIASSSEDFDTKWHSPLTPIKDKRKHLRSLATYLGLGDRDFTLRSDEGVVCREANGVYLPLTVGEVIERWEAQQAESNHASA